MFIFVELPYPFNHHLKQSVYSSSKYTATIRCHGKSAASIFNRKTNLRDQHIPQMLSRKKFEVEMNYRRLFGRIDTHQNDFIICIPGISKLFVVNKYLAIFSDAQRLKSFA